MEHEALTIAYQSGYYEGKKAALAQPAQKHVAWNKQIRDSVDSLLEQAGYQPDSSARNALSMMNFDAQPLPVQPEQEPVAWTLLLTGEHTGMVGKAGEKFVGAPDYYQRVNVYTTPPQRPWVGLTPEDILVLFDEHNLYGSKLVEFTRAVETKIKEKNND